MLEWKEGVSGGMGRSGEMVEFAKVGSENRATPAVVFVSGGGERQVQPSVKSLKHTPELQCVTECSHTGSPAPGRTRPSVHWWRFTGHRIYGLRFTESKESGIEQKKLWIVKITSTMALRKCFLRD